MITLRKNQTEPIQKAIDFFQKKESKPSLIVLPTAWGKSILTAYVSKSITEKLLVVNPSRELLLQNYQKYLSLCSEFETRAGIFSASFNKKDIDQITYVTIGSIKKLGAVFKRLGFKKMLIDEAHLYPREADSMLGTFLKESGITHVLGITATPVKLQTNVDASGGRYSKLVMLTSRSKKGNFFKDIIHVGQVQEMVELGFWSKLTYKVTGFDSSLLVYNTAKSEYTEDSVESTFNSNDVHGSILSTINSLQDRKHILVFVPSVREAISLSEQCENSAAVYGTMDKRKREAVINDFKSGKIRVIMNCRVLSTGFDYTGIDCIILGFSTASIALFYQILGRATRIDPNKQDALIVDLAGNVNRFGHVEDITFEQGVIWRMFGTDGKLLTGIPIHEIGTITRKDVGKVESAASNSAGQCAQTGTMETVEIMPFGKYKGSRTQSLPIGYAVWLLDNFNWTPANAKLRQSLLNRING
jgi:DNA repair protein RadD